MCGTVVDATLGRPGAEVDEEADRLGVFANR
jgi:hypothetical protein